MAGPVVNREQENQSPEPGNFKSNPRKDAFCEAEQVSYALNNPQSVVIDVRSSGRFHGIQPEPRQGLRPGHMPGAKNLPFSSLLENGRLKSVDALKELFLPLAALDQQLIFTCGSGVTACIGALAADRAGYSNLCVYDGSWSEWGLPSGRPVVKG